MRRPVGVKSIRCGFGCSRCFSQPSRHCRHPSTRTLRRAIGFARCKLGVLVSAVLPPDCRPFHLQGWKLGQAINAVTGTRRLGFVFPIDEPELCGRRQRQAHCCCVAVRRPLHSPTADAAKQRAFVLSQSQLVSSHSSHHSFDSLQSNPHCAHGPRSLHVPGHSCLRHPDLLFRGRESRFGPGPKSLGRVKCVEGGGTDISLPE